MSTVMVYLLAFIVALGLLSLMIFLAVRFRRNMRRNREQIIQLEEHSCKAIWLNQSVVTTAKDKAAEIVIGKSSSKFNTVQMSTLFLHRDVV